MFNFNIVSSWLHGLLTGFMPEWGAILTESILVALAIITLYAVFAIVLIYMERKICAFFQCRLGRPDACRSLGFIAGVQRCV